MKQSKKYSFNKEDFKRWCVTLMIVALGAVVAHLITEVSKMPQTETTVLVIALLKAAQYFLQGR